MLLQITIFRNLHSNSASFETSEILTLKCFLQKTSASSRNSVALVSETHIWTPLSDALFCKVLFWDFFSECCFDIISERFFSLLFWTRVNALFWTMLFCRPSERIFQKSLNSLNTCFLQIFLKHFSTRSSSDNFCSSFSPLDIFL